MSFEQAVVQLEQTNSKLQEEVVRFRDAAMGLNNIYSTITEGRQNTADGKYFSVPGNGAYMRLYRRQGSSAELIAEFPDRAELNSVIDQLGPLLGRGVTGGLNNLGNGGELVRLADAPFASRAHFGNYHSGQSANQNIDQAISGECALYSTANMGVFPENSGSFIWVETQRLYGGHALVQKAVNYANTANSSSAALKIRSWKRLCSNALNSEGERIWGDWVEDVSSQTIVGNVEQSSVMESGSNEDGYYVKFADGTMICRTRVLFSYNASTWQSFPSPKQFVGTFSVSWSFSASGYEQYSKWKAVAFSHYGSNGFRGIYRIEGTTLAYEDFSESLDIVIFGRWKA
ncbi:hypothetical protein [Vreelandella venusta]|uniref:hypothetical protein n=1 Tax=Vreelandella venusta TaxID=44935 RepID=UPI0018DA8C44|nr:hypothetical protein [Halomonas venusta]QPI65937.1 hypothetical protein IR195_09670 [Halomonas venusta]